MFPDRLLGLLAQQVDAKGQRTSFVYDLLGRMIERTDNAQAPALRATTSWHFDTAVKGIGKPWRVIQDGYQLTYAYDAWGRASQTTEAFDPGDPGQLIVGFATSYDALGRPSVTTYPGNSARTRNVYNARGYLEAVENDFNGNDYWRALAMDARGNVSRFTHGNGVETLRGFEAQTGRISGITTTNGAGQRIQDLGYAFDDLGNLVMRRDDLPATPAIETFVYDGLSRLKTVVTDYKDAASPAVTTVNILYGPQGNMLARTGMGSYTYGGSNPGICAAGSSAGPHAVSAIAGNHKNADYCYDANGSMVSGDGRGMVWSAYDMPIRIDKGANRVEFAYGPDRQRIKRFDTLTGGVTTTYYIGGKAMERVWKPDGSIEQRLFLGDFAMVTLTTQGGTTTGATRYLHHDHLGSIDAITGAGGSLIERLSFDAWGKRRQSTWLPMAGTSGLQSFSPNLNQGYTGHEMLDPVGLIHMNGRVYDPEIGRFLSADPFVQDISSLQAWNRYSYVLNNPLSMTDPSGFFFGSIAKFMGNLFGEIINAIGSVFKAVLNVPILRAAIQVVACTSGGPAGCIAAAGAIAAAAGGSITDALQAMAFSAASMGIWDHVHSMLEPFKALGTAGFAAVKSGVHGAVGGALSVAQGGSFMEGFAANGIGGVASTFAEGLTVGGRTNAASTAIATVGGSLGAMAVGGKFANGAITAAFAHLYNDLELLAQSGCRTSCATYDAPPAFGDWTVHGGQYYASGRAEDASHLYYEGAAGFGLGRGISSLFGGVASVLTGQTHHAISRPVFSVLERHPLLRGSYSSRDPRFVTRAKDLGSHSGYQAWHRQLDREVMSWIRNNPGATQRSFESYLRGRYGQSDLRQRFPNGL